MEEDYYQIVKFFTIVFFIMFILLIPVTIISGYEVETINTYAVTTIAVGLVTGALCCLWIRKMI